MSRNYDDMHYQEQIFFGTHRITNMTKEECGTGFLYHDNNIDITLLITNKHILSDDKSRYSVMFFENKDRINLRHDRLNIVLNGIEDRMYNHDDDNIDLACLDITEYINTEKFYSVRFNNKIIRNIEDIEILPGDKVMYVGYPESTDNIVNLPILRVGHIASLHHLRFFNNNDNYIIDTHIYHGSSGSPVLLEKNGKVCLIGVVSGFIGKDMLAINSQSSASDSFIIPKIPLGIASVIKHTRIVELLKKVHVSLGF
jgi:V8-like Glu-specific endopeptidase